ncbi:hypothetical protein EZS27_021033 [termite gut metagenome]|uniref:Uncharacterized protein n=1 Tax=termite gut metagenome TaxID=433724 RepID=A0A5J4R922_9ZZZZ
MKKVIITVAKTGKGYSATCDLLEGWIVAVTGSFQELEKEVKESINFYVDCAKEDGGIYPSVFESKYELQYVFDVESLLCYYDKIFTKAALEHITGINQKQLSHYACGRSQPRRDTAEKIVQALHALGHELIAVSV